MKWCTRVLHLVYLILLRDLHHLLIRNSFPTNDTWFSVEQTYGYNKRITNCDLIHRICGIDILSSQYTGRFELRTRREPCGKLWERIQYTEDLWRVIKAEMLVSTVPCTSRTKPLFVSARGSHLVIGSQFGAVPPFPIRTPVPPLPPLP